jgi:DNA-binding LacI/PurR family transcriptional regulator
MTDVQTISDIARLAGVSKSTVSRALNDSPLIGEETKQRIRAIAQEHRFQLNEPARRLSLGQSQVAALVTWGYKADLGTPDAFMLELLSGVAAGLHEQGYDLLHVQVSPSDTDWIERYLGSGRVDGFVLLEATCSPAQLRTLIDSKAPFVLWGGPARNHEYSSVIGDSFAGGRLATEHLLASGRRRVAFVGAAAHHHEMADRLRGWEAAHAAAGVEPDPGLVVHGDYTPGSARAAVRTLFDAAEPPDALFVPSDLRAIAAIDELRTRGLRVPEDVAVVGYDDIAVAAVTSPPLTTIRQNVPLAGRLLADALVRQLQTGAVSHATLPAELVVRASA